ncbi:calcium-binding protein 7 isoform X1 [Grus americana]|uniref:calcium-binding protein 7 isoform X1 n=1 Tax=Grus americana TaxID=9117 RepID=UPI00240813C8|nr:calcium-binding protein 7 isoform X1 [Grus americana]
MPFHPVTAALMYRGIYTIPNILAEQHPVEIPEDELEEIREAFKVFDRDGNGFISKQELGTAMRSLGYMPNEVELEVIIQRLDMDGDGQVDFEEFVTLLGPKLSTSGIPEKFHGTDFDTVFWKHRCAPPDPGGRALPECPRPLPAVRHAEADGGRAEAAAVRHLLRAPLHEGHREHHHDGGGEPHGHGRGVPRRRGDLLQPADPPDLRAQEPHLRLCHRLHHQRDAHRRQPGAAQRHEVAGPPRAPASGHRRGATPLARSRALCISIYKSDTQTPPWGGGKPQGGRPAPGPRCPRATRPHGCLQNVGTVTKTHANTQTHPPPRQEGEPPPPNPSVHVTCMEPRVLPPPPGGGSRRIHRY